MNAENDTPARIGYDTIHTDAVVCPVAIEGIDYVVGIPMADADSDTDSNDTRPGSDRGWVWVS